MPRAKAPKLTSPGERKRIADGAADLDYESALKVLGIAEGDRRWGPARNMLEQIAANHRVACAAERERTPARQIAMLKAMLRLLKVQAKKGDPTSPFFPHTCDIKDANGDGGDKKVRHEGTLSMELEMAVAREIRAIEMATSGLSVGAKQVAAINAVIDRLKGPEFRGRQYYWTRDVMVEQLVDVAANFDPSLYAHVEGSSSITVQPKRLWDFIIAFMVDVMGMEYPDIEGHRDRFYKLLPNRKHEARKRATEARNKARKRLWELISAYAKNGEQVRVNGSGTAPAC